VYGYDSSCVNVHAEEVASGGHAAEPSLVRSLNKYALLLATMRAWNKALLLLLAPPRRRGGESHRCAGRHRFQVHRLHTILRRNPKQGRNLFLVQFHNRPRLNSAPELDASVGAARDEPRRTTRSGLGAGGQQCERRHARVAELGACTGGTGM
jgi:hypothetical protein